MDKSAFNLKLSHFNQYTLAEKTDIQMERNHFPYCSLLQAMDLLSDKAVDAPHWESRLLPAMALYLHGDMDKLNRALSSVELVAAIVQPEPQPETKPAKPAKQPADNDSEFDIMKEINAYQEVSFKTAPKSVILSNFLETGNYNEQDLGHASTTPIEVLGKNSIRKDESLETETLAVVFERQGKFDKAIAIYEKLIARNPEKSSTFAARIAKLQEIINSK